MLIIKKNAKLSINKKEEGSYKEAGVWTRKEERDKKEDNKLDSARTELLV